MRAPVGWLCRLNNGEAVIPQPAAAAPHAGAPPAQGPIAAAAGAAAAPAPADAALQQRNSHLQQAAPAAAAAAAAAAPAGALLPQQLEDALSESALIDGFSLQSLLKDLPAAQHAAANGNNGAGDSMVLGTMNAQQIQAHRPGAHHCCGSQSRARRGRPQGCGAASAGVAGPFLVVGRAAMERERGGRGTCLTARECPRVPDACAQTTGGVRCQSTQSCSCCSSRPTCWACRSSLRGAAGQGARGGARTLSTHPRRRPPAPLPPETQVRNAKVRWRGEGSGRGGGGAGTPPGARGRRS